MLRISGTIGREQVFELAATRLDYTGRGSRYRYSITTRDEHVATIVHDRKDGAQVLARHALGALIQHQLPTNKGTQ